MRWSPIRSKNGCIIQKGLLYFGIIMLIGAASATILPLNTFETQGITTSTTLSIEGGMSSTTDLSWELSSEVLGANIFIIPFNPPLVVPEPPLHPSGEVQMYCSYRENTIVQSGSLDYRRISSVDTDATITGQYNVMNERLINYVADPGSRLYSEEALSLTTVGNSIPTQLSLACPFGVQNIGICTPAFCNQIEAGSVLDMTLVSAHTNADTRTVNRGNPLAWPPVPYADDPVQFQYQIRVTGINPPAHGLVSAYSGGYTREASGACPRNGLSQEITFREDVRVDGDIDLFNYLLDYESGIRR